MPKKPQDKKELTMVKEQFESIDEKSSLPQQTKLSSKRSSLVNQNSLPNMETPRNKEKESSQNSKSQTSTQYKLNLDKVEGPLKDEIIRKMGSVENLQKAVELLN